MKTTQTKLDERAFYFHKFENTAEDIPQITSIIEFSGQKVKPLDPEDTEEVSLRWASNNRYLLIPHNGIDIRVPLGYYVVVDVESKQLDVYSEVGFSIIFKSLE